LVLGFTAIPTGKVFTSIPELDKLEGGNEEALAISPSSLILLAILPLLSLLLSL
jgi:hypothetical protein